MQVERTIIARWQEWSGEGFEHLVLHERLDGIVAEGMISATEGFYDLAAQVPDQLGFSHRQDLQFVFENTLATRWAVPQLQWLVATTRGCAYRCYIVA